MKATDMTTSLPVVDLRGSAFERGRQHGAALRDLVRHNLGVYFARFEYSADLSRQEVRHRAKKYRDAIADQTPAYAEAMRGLADGAGCDEVEIVALNVRFELLYQRWGEQLQTVDGCTAFAILPAQSATGSLITGQNWDWIPHVRCAVLRTRRDEGPASVAFTEAGIVGGKIGFNEAGVTLAVNGLMTIADDWTRMRRPFHVRCEDVLAAATFDDAVQAVIGEPRNCSANFLIGGLPDRAVSLETAPDAHMAVSPDASGCVVHSNHFVDGPSIGVIEPPNERRPHSCYRRERMTQRIASAPTPVRIADLQEWLSEHEGEPEGLCRHDEDSEPHDQIVTVTAAIIEPTERRMHLTPSQPCLGNWQTVTL